MMASRYPSQEERPLNALVCRHALAVWNQHALAEIEAKSLVKREEPVAAHLFQLGARRPAEGAAAAYAAEIGGAAGFTALTPLEPLHHRFQPPRSIGGCEATFCSTVPQSDCRATSGVHLSIKRRVQMSDEIALRFHLTSSGPGAAADFGTLPDRATPFALAVLSRGKRHHGSQRAAAQGMTGAR
jgi:hypothetical protein